MIHIKLSKHSENFTESLHCCNIFILQKYLEQIRKKTKKKKKTNSSKTEVNLYSQISSDPSLK